MLPILFPHKPRELYGIVHLNTSSVFLSTCIQSNFLSAPPYHQDWKDGEITQQDYRSMKTDYERQVAALSDVQERLTAEQAELANGVDNEHPALVAFMKYQNIDKLTREALIDLVDHIKVYENGNISVKCKFADEFRKIAEYIEINTSEIPAVGGLSPATSFLAVCFPNKI